jgi:N-acetylneuraminic acid mutarotase
MRRRLVASCLLILATAALAGTRALPTQAALATGLWSTVASLITGRQEHTATLLPNGNVLIAGGMDDTGNGLASAEVYHPATNRWTAAHSMAAARFDHTATLLPSGKVLVTGGLAGPLPFGSLASSELYDPVTDSWSAAAPMIGSRTRHTATLLPDGRVLVVGGLSLVVREGGLFPSVATDAEIYDPRANGWSITAPMGFDRFDHTATLLADGSVMVAGGRGELATFKSTEIYDATNDRWVSAAPMDARRYGQVATLLPDGDVLVAGGIGEAPDARATTLDTAEIYNPSTNLWVTVASMTNVDVTRTATRLGNGMVLVVGMGQSASELYDPARNVWSRTGPSIHGHQDSATLLSDGTVLLVGGYGDEPFSSVLVYDPNAVVPVPRQPLDPRIAAGLLLAMLLLVASIALSIPAIRQRLRSWRPQGEPEEWIT